MNFGGEDFDSFLSALEEEIKEKQASGDGDGDGDSTTSAGVGALSDVLRVLDDGAERAG